jgi:hypothetical protein
VIVRPEHYHLWLDPEVRDPTALEPFPAKEMRAIPVSTRVNGPKNNDVDLIEPDVSPTRNSLVRCDSQQMSYDGSRAGAD